MEANHDKNSPNIPQSTRTSSKGKPERINPDLKFIRDLSFHSGDLFGKCMQCGTCSGTCDISPDDNPFPRKEMAWAIWGLKERLLADPDVWLCHQCNDCSTRCPRGAKPGELLNAIRKESVTHYSFPNFMGRWVNQPSGLLILLFIPTLLLALATYFKDNIAELFGFAVPVGDRILYSYSAFFPHWLLISFFLFFSVLAMSVGIIGILRFWKGMKTSFVWEEGKSPEKGIWESIVATIRNVIGHKYFSSCTVSKNRNYTHVLVFSGFIALSVVALWIVTAGINPLLKDGFVYPFNFLSPWKLLANIGGLAMLVGIGWIGVERVLDSERTGTGSYYDWLFIGTILMVLFTGFFTEALHYVRLEPHRHLIYFVHLVAVFFLLIYLPYSKFAHMFYRFTAMVFAEYTGRELKHKDSTIEKTASIIDIKEVEEKIVSQEVGGETA